MFPKKNEFFQQLKGAKQEPILDHPCYYTIIQNVLCASEVSEDMNVYSTCVWPVTIPFYEKNTNQRSVTHIVSHYYDFYYALKNKIQIKHLVMCFLTQYSSVLVRRAYVSSPQF